MTVPSLASRVPEFGFGSDSDALDAFLEWTADHGLKLYAHQEEAILELFAGHHVVLDTPTGSGKSLVATALHFKTFANLGRAFYTAPIKALVSEKFFELCRHFGADAVAIGHSVLMALNCNKHIEGVTDYEAEIGVPAGLVEVLVELAGGLAGFAIAGGVIIALVVSVAIALLVESITGLLR